MVILQVFTPGKVGRILKLKSASRLKSGLIRREDVLLRSGRQVEKLSTFSKIDYNKLM